MCRVSLYKKNANYYHTVNDMKVIELKMLFHDWGFMHSDEFFASRGVGFTLYKTTKNHYIHYVFEF